MHNPLKIYIFIFFRRHFRSLFVDDATERCLLELARSALWFWFETLFRGPIKMSRDRATELVYFPTFQISNVKFTTILQFYSYHFYHAMCLTSMFIGNRSFITQKHMSFSDIRETVIPVELRFSSCTQTWILYWSDDAFLGSSPPHRGLAPKNETTTSTRKAFSDFLTFQNTLAGQCSAAQHHYCLYINPGIWERPFWLQMHFFSNRCYRTTIFRRHKCNHYYQ